MCNIEGTKGDSFTSLIRSTPTLSSPHLLWTPLMVDYVLSIVHECSWLMGKISNHKKIYPTKIIKLKRLSWHYGGLFNVRHVYYEKERGEERVSYPTALSNYYPNSHPMNPQQCVIKMARSDCTLSLGQWCQPGKSKLLLLFQCLKNFQDWQYGRHIEKASLILENSQWN